MMMQEFDKEGGGAASSIDRNENFSLMSEMKEEECEEY